MCGRHPIGGITYCRTVTQWTHSEQRTVSGRTRIHRIERRNDDDLCCWALTEKWPRQYLGCHRRTRSQQSRELPSVFPFPAPILAVATLLENCGSPRWFREETASNFIKMAHMCVLRHNFGSVPACRHAVSACRYCHSCFSTWESLSPCAHSST